MNNKYFYVSNKIPVQFVFELYFESHFYSSVPETNSKDLSFWIILHRIVTHICTFHLNNILMDVPVFVFSIFP